MQAGLPIGIKCNDNTVRPMVPIDMRSSILVENTGIFNDMCNEPQISFRIKTCFAGRPLYIFACNIFLPSSEGIWKKILKNSTSSAFDIVYVKNVGVLLHKINERGTRRTPVGRTSAGRNFHAPFFVRIAPRLLESHE